MKHTLYLIKLHKKYYYINRFFLLCIEDAYISVARHQAERLQEKFKIDKPDFIADIECPHKNKLFSVLKSVISFK